MKYSTAVPLGRGAMGEVLEAWDPELERKVAIKLLRRDDPRAAERMLREARAQARVDHPNVCQVYEVGETDGRPFIAMQLVDGVPLDEALADRSVQEKVQVVRQVAEAVQAAHAAGLIHRDLKPSNVLVETAADGRLVPYVLDFGIAREQALEGLTVTGQFLGTPGYLSPEQARGEVTRLDGRSDVFSLGVMLYELLAGRLPFPGDSAAETLVVLLQGDPVPIRRIAPGVDVDLATIVMRCLERDPDGRYRSARALARDLGHWLEGEPIEARPAGFLARQLRRARRRPALTASVAIAVLAVLASLAFGAYSQWQAAREARWADRFGQQAERLDNELRLIHMLPLHDVREDRALAEQDLERLRVEVEDAGGVAAGPADLALGRGLLRLGRLGEARTHLERAWADGYRTPGVALALGRTLVELYGRELDATSRIADEEVQRARREVAEAELARPARQLLATVDPTAGDLAPHETAYLSGLLALAEGELAAAEAKGLDAATLRPWFHDGKLLAAGAALLAAGERIEGGEPEAAEAALDRASRLFAAAARVAPSDVEPHLGSCRAAVRGLSWIWDTSPSEPVATEGWAEGCDRALVVDPEGTEAHVLRAEGSWTLARIRARDGESPQDLLDSAMGDAEQALGLDPSRASAWAQLGNAQWIRARWMGDHGEDATPLYEEAVSSLEEGLQRKPGDAFLTLSLANVLNDWGSAAVRLGQDPTEIWNRTRAVLEAALAMPGGRSSRLLNNLCALDSEVGYRRFTQGADSTEALARSVAACEAALAINPRYLAALNNLGLARWTQADALAANGGDPGPPLTDAIERYEDILEIDPGRPSTSVNLANLLVSRARWSFERGEDPGEDLALASEVIFAARERFPSEYHFLEAKVALLAGEVLARGGASPMEALDRALVEGERALRLALEGAAPMVLASTRARRAEWLATREAPDLAGARREASAGLRRLEQILDREPEHVEALRERARLARLRADLAGDEAERAHWLELSRDSASAAVGLRPALAEELGDLLRPAG